MGDKKSEAKAAGSQGPFSQPVAGLVGDDVDPDGIRSTPEMVSGAVLRGGRLDDDTEKSLARKRSVLFGSLWGAATAVTLAVPPVADAIQLFSEPTAATFAAVLVATNTLSAAALYHFFVQPKGENLGKIGTLVGCVTGGATALVAHAVVPFLVLGLPAILDFGMANWAAVDWATEFPVDAANYGVVLAWWGIADFGMRTIPTGAVLGIGFSAVATQIIKAAGLDVGQWSSGMDLRDPDVIKEETRQVAQSRLAQDREAQVVAALSNESYRGKV
jgi:hypothetical protein